MHKTSWLPVTRDEMLKIGWENVDIIIVSGDAYVDHPSFGHAMIARMLEYAGYRVAILAQPNWKDDLRDFKKFGRPRLFFGVTSGCMDSMVNHYTALKRKRNDDAYTPGGKAGFRPDYATNVYCKILKDLYPETPVIIGGVEASLRRTTHYDYWSDSLLPSILIDSKADMLVYGMGEHAIIEIAQQLKSGKSINEIREVPQTAFLIENNSSINNNKWQSLNLPSHEECLKNKKLFGKHFTIIETESNKMFPNRLTQNTGNKKLIINPPYPPAEANINDIPYDLPYTRMPHPKYKKRGQIPAYEMIKFSVNIHRGCFGGCSFCTISAHQGKFINNRTEKSIINEIIKISKTEDFKGYISDLGGPSANMFEMKGANINLCKKCIRPSCIYPSQCKNLITNHKVLLKLYDKVMKLDKIKKVTIGSGIRYDMLCGKTKTEDIKNNYTEYIKKIASFHVSGRLKIAPEHTSDKVLKIMRKPTFKHYKEFTDKFYHYSLSANLKQEIIPYFISSHPGCTIEDMTELAAKIKKSGLRPEQVQDFTPTPMTLSSVLYYCGFNPYTNEKIYCAKSKNEKQEQNRMFFYYKKENYDKLKRTLYKTGKNEHINHLLKK